MKAKRTFYFISFFISICLIIIFIYCFYNIKYPIKYKDEIVKYSSEYGLSSSLVASVINSESSFNKNATSNAGAIGLMQIIPSTAEYICDLLNEEFFIENLYDPEKNIKYGCFYLRYLKNKFIDENTTLCAYNAGETIVFNWLKDKNISSNGISLDGKIPFNVTKNYANNIIKNKKYYLGRV